MSEFKSFLLTEYPFTCICDRLNYRSRSRSTRSTWHILTDLEAVSKVVFVIILRCFSVVQVRPSDNDFEPSEEVGTTNDCGAEMQSSMANRIDEVSERACSAISRYDVCDIVDITRRLEWTFAERGQPTANRRRNLSVVLPLSAGRRQARRNVPNAWVASKYAIKSCRVARWEWNDPIMAAWWAWNDLSAVWWA